MKKFYLCNFLICLLTLMPILSYSSDVIKIGVVGPDTDIGMPSYNAVEIVVDKYNKAGGLLGKQIEIIYIDNQCKADIAKSEALQLAKMGVSAVIGHVCPEVTTVALGIYEKAKIISLSPDATLPSLTLDGNFSHFLRTAPHDYSHAELAISFMKQRLQQSKLAIFHDGTLSGQIYTEKILQLSKNDANIKVVFSRQIPENRKDLSRQIKELKGNAEILIYGGHERGAHKLIASLMAENSCITFVGSHSLNNVAFAEFSSTYKGDIYTTGIRDTKNTPSLIRARKELLLRFGKEPSLNFYSAYAAIQALLEAMERGNSINSEDILAILKDKYFKTPLGRISFTPQGDVEGLELSVFKIQNKNFINDKYHLKVR